MLCTKQNLTFNFHFIQKAYSKWFEKTSKTLDIFSFNYRKDVFKNNINVTLAYCKPLYAQFRYSDSSEQRPGQ